MTGRRKSRQVAAEAAPAAQEEPVVRGQRLTTGKYVSIKGERGVFVFAKINRDGSGCFYGGRTGYGMWRDFPIDRVTRIHKDPPRT